MIIKHLNLKGNHVELLFKLIIFLFVFMNGIVEFLFNDHINLLLSYLLVLLNVAERLELIFVIYFRHCQRIGLEIADESFCDSDELFRVLVDLSDV